MVPQRDIETNIICEKSNNKFPLVLYCLILMSYQIEMQMDPWSLILRGLKR